jgi:hypothetical protein
LVRRLDNRSARIIARAMAVPSETQVFVDARHLNSPGCGVPGRLPPGKIGDA